MEGTEGQGTCDAVSMAGKERQGTESANSGL